MCLIFRLISWSILFVFLDLKVLIPLLVNLAANYSLSVVHNTRATHTAASTTHLVWISAVLGVVFPCQYAKTDDVGQSNRSV